MVKKYKELHWNYTSQSVLYISLVSGITWPYGSPAYQKIKNPHQGYIQELFVCENFTEKELKLLFRSDAEYSKHLDLDDCADHSLMQRSEKQNPKTAQSPSWWANLMNKDKEAGGHYTLRAMLSVRT